MCIGALDGFVSPRGFKLTPRATAAVPAVPAGGVTLSLARNPTFGEGDVSWSTVTPGAATLTVYDVTGRWVTGRHFPHLAAGVSQVAWRSLTAGSELARGVYMLRLDRTGGSSERARVMVMR